MLEEAAIVPLASLSENVGAGVPEDSLALGIVNVEELKAAIPLKHTVQIPLLRVDLVDPVPSFSCGLIEEKRKKRKKERKKKGKEK